MRRIGIYLVSEPYVGGTFQYNQSVLDVLLDLQKEGYEIVIFYRKDLWKDYLKAYSFHLIKVKYDIILRIFLKFQSIFKCRNFFYRFLITQFTPFSRTIDSQECDLIICPSQDFLPALIRTPTLGTIHDLMHRYETNFPEVSANGEFERREFLYKSICKFSTAILADSAIGKQHIIESYGDYCTNKIFILPFIPPKYLFQTHMEKVKKFDLPHKYIFYPAQFWEHKNHKKLLLALSLLQKKRMYIHVVLVGSKKNGYDEVVELIQELNLKPYVHILGYVDELQMKTLYQNARAMVMPSFFGPTNIPPLEGFALGCPVAVSKIYGMPEQAGDAALYFDPNSIEEIANVLYILWNDDVLCQQLIEKGYKRAKLFTQEKFNEKFKEIIQHILYTTN